MNEEKASDNDDHDNDTSPGAACGDTPRNADNRRPIPRATIPTTPGEDSADRHSEISVGGGRAADAHRDELPPEVEEKVNHNDHDNHNPGQEPEGAEVEGFSGGDSVPVRPVGSPLLPDDAGDAAAPSHGQEKPTFSAGGLDARKIASIEQTLALIENHLHLPMIFPETDKLREIRENLPEVYKIYLAAAKSDVKATEIERTAPFVVPDKYARRGQTYGLIATVLVLILVGYCVYAGSTILAGIFGTIDLIALVAVFGANQKPKER